MTVSRTDLVALLAPNGPTELVKRFMRDIEPLCRVAEDGVLRLAEAERLNEGNVGKAIANATCEEVSGLMIVSAKGEKLSDGIHHEDAYESFLALAMRLRRHDDFVVKHGELALERLIYPLWFWLCEDLVAATRRSYGDFFGSVHHTLAHDLTYGSSIVLAYGAAYVAQGEAERYVELRGLIRLLPWILPIGSPLDSGGIWLVLAE